MIRVSFPLDEVLEVSQPRGVDTWEWTCRICDDDGFVSTQQGAERIGILHLKAFHGANDG